MWLIVAIERITEGMENVTLEQNQKKGSQNKKNTIINDNFFLQHLRYAWHLSLRLLQADLSAHQDEWQVLRWGLDWLRMRKVEQTSCTDVMFHTEGINRRGDRTFKEDKATTLFSQICFYLSNWKSFCLKQHIFFFFFWLYTVSYSPLQAWT